MLSTSKIEAIHKANIARSDKCFEERIMKYEQKIDDQLQRMKVKLVREAERKLHEKRIKLKKKAMLANNGEFKVYYELLES